MSSFRLELGKSSVIHLKEEQDPAATAPVTFEIQAEGKTIMLRLKRSQALQLSHAFKFMAETE